MHHGRTVAAWVGSTIALVGFIVGGIAMVIGRTGRCSGSAVGLLVVALIATKVLQVMGFGAD